MIEVQKPCPATDGLQQRRDTSLVLQFKGQEGSRLQDTSEPQRKGDPELNGSIIGVQVAFLSQPGAVTFLPLKRERPEVLSL